MPRWSLKCKVCLVGESAVGKTSLIKKFVLDIFDDTYLSTLGTKVSKKTVQFETEAIQVAMNLMIWDIMGQSGFRSLLQDSYFFGASGVIAVCDLTRRDTLSALDEWLKSVTEVAGDVPVVFLANKCDLKEGLQITEKELELKAAKYGAPLFLTSAKTGQNVNAGFQALGEAIAKRQAKGSKPAQ